MRCVERFTRLSTRRQPIKAHGRRFAASLLVVTIFSSSTVVVSSLTASASNIANARASATVLYQQIQSIGGRVESLGQKYDLARINLQRFNNQIKNSKDVVVQIELKITKGSKQLRKDAIFAYVTNGAASSLNPIFSSDRLKADAINVYNQIVGGNVNATLASLKYHKIKLTQERSILYKQERRANSAAHDAATSFHDANVLRASLEHELSQVKGQIATFIVQQEAEAAAASAAALKSAKPTQGVVAPPPNSRANIAVRTALSMIGVPYVWGGASRSGVDCSGLVLLAYAAAGVSLPHYSGSQYAATERVPLWNIQPGDLLFYGPNGSEHEAMYIGNGQMVEAASSGTLVHISPIRLDPGFIGLGRVRT